MELLIVDVVHTMHMCSKRGRRRPCTSSYATLPPLLQPGTDTGCLVKNQWEKDCCRSLVRTSQCDGACEQAPGETPGPRLPVRGGVAGWPRSAGSGFGFTVRVTVRCVKDENGKGASCVQNHILSS